ncbi:hypothetical protein M404DRAFT_1003833 [Pisolithus tinctorius Marx 270]|uniref:Uncharacterized protein n=1 Tax=Pisolithus tinctorius Marx 270 TaxID=870435 RepID=A0A0C3JSE5_PISTI|nr:hypothetical protein M404DRAFT_1003833 [Pisolithus tinctorius Marx 270]
MVASEVAGGGNFDPKHRQGPCLHTQFLTTEVAMLMITMRPLTFPSIAAGVQ